MDWVLSYADAHVLTPYVYPAHVAEDNLLRQLASLFVMVCLGAIAMYFALAGLSYVFIFDKTLRKHKKFIKDQVRPRPAGPGQRRGREGERERRSSHLASVAPSSALTGVGSSRGGRGARAAAGRLQAGPGRAQRRHRCPVVCSTRLFAVGRMASWTAVVSATL